MVLLLHGERGLTSARRCTKALFGGANLEDLKLLSAAEIASTFPGAGVVQISLNAGSDADVILDSVGKSDDNFDNERDDNVPRQENTNSEIIHSNNTNADYNDSISRQPKPTLVDVVLSTQHCQKMILAKRPNFKPHVVENIARTNAVKLIHEGAVKINFIKIVDEQFHDFHSCVMRTAEVRTEGDVSYDDVEGEGEAWSLLTIAKKHQYIIKWR